MPIRKTFWWALILTNLVALPILLYFNQKFSQQKQAQENVLPVLGRIGDFVMTDFMGGNFTRKNLEGRVWIVNFMFTRCPSQCPAMNLKMSMLRGILDSSVGLLSLSVDPEHDTPEVLRGYADRYSAVPGSWNFLTGSRAELNKVLSYCHLGASDDPNLHGMKLVLIDEGASVRAYYDYDDPLLSKKIIADITRLKKRGPHAR